MASQVDELAKKAAGLKVARARCEVGGPGQADLRQWSSTLQRKVRGSCPVDDRRRRGAPPPAPPPAFLARFRLNEPRIAAWMRTAAATFCS